MKVQSGILNMKRSKLAKRREKSSFGLFYGVYRVSIFASIKLLKQQFLKITKQKKFTNLNPITMSFKAKFNVAGKELNVLNVNYDLHQTTNASGSASSVVRGGKINVTIESTGDSFFFEWMTNSFERKNGSIVFLKPDTEAKLKEILFEDGYLTNYKEEFDHNSDTPLTETFTISSRVISSGGGELVQEWAN